ncbi:hypothetical protein [Pseudogemmobacter bohemicus]|uniref:hypothetical protein n=1 Tax=Pseudogemmobacter bohemicus TaxID=2250708 RepID=UPI001E2A5442|nr:hypothetical protein [Pseudogemmobacter bohemicus]
MTPEPSADHSTCIQGWLTALMGDKRAIFTAAAAAAAAAAAHARRAAYCLHGLQSPSGSGQLPTGRVCRVSGTSPEGGQGAWKPTASHGAVSRCTSTLRLRHSVWLTT